MLSKISDFFSIITADLKDEFVTQRTAVVRALNADESVGENFDAWVSLALNGLPSDPQSAQPVLKVIAAIKEQQPSFPSDPASRTLDLRITVALVLGEHMLERGAHSRSIAGLLTTGSELRAWDQDQFLILVENLRIVAFEVLDECAVEVRARSSIVAPKLSGNDPQQIADFSTALKKFAAIVESNQRADREELQILWWVMRSTSKDSHKPYSALQMGDAAIGAALDLGELMLTPPVAAATDFLRSVLRDETSVALSQLVGEASLQSLKRATAGLSAECEEIVRTRPALLPLTWLASRLVQSEKAPWEVEFERMTGLSPGLEQPLWRWAGQVLRESAAMQLIDSESSSD